MNSEISDSEAYERERIEANERYERQRAEDNEAYEQRLLESRRAYAKHRKDRSDLEDSPVRGDQSPSRHKSEED